MAIRTITILMGVYNGGALLTSQLQSLAAQDDPDWRLIASDDGSTDDTKARIRDFSDEAPQEIHVLDGPGQGFSANFMSLIAGLRPQSGPVAFADQDDVWLNDKLTRGRAALEGADPSRPTLYCARRWIWWPGTDQRWLPPLPRRGASFRNALVENIAPGNTIMLNPAAADLARRAALRTGDVFAHDWWLYLLITGAGGRVLVDEGPACLLYRQHDGNAIGEGRAVSAQVRRKLAVLRGAFRDRLTGNFRAMLAIEDMLMPENAHLLRAFEAARQAPLPARLNGLRIVAPYRQTIGGTLGFWGAAFLGRV